MPRRHLSTILLICSWLHLGKGLARTDKYWFVAEANQQQNTSCILRASGWGCSACAYVDLPCMAGQTCGPSGVFYLKTCYSALPEDMLLCSPWLTKQPTIEDISDLLPNWHGRCHAERGLGHLQAKLRQQAAFTHRHSPDETKSMSIPKEETFACAQVCHCHSLPIDRAALGGPYKVELVAKPHIPAPNYILSNQKTSKKYFTELCVWGKSTILPLPRKMAYEIRMLLKHLSVFLSLGHSALLLIL